MLQNNIVTPPAPGVGVWAQETNHAVAKPVVRKHRSCQRWYLAVRRNQRLLPVQKRSLAPNYLATRMKRYAKRRPAAGPPHAKLPISARSVPTTWGRLIQGLQLVPVSSPPCPQPVAAGQLAPRNRHYSCVDWRLFVQNCVAFANLFAP